MPFTPKIIGLSLDRGGRKAPTLKTMTKLPDIGIKERDAIGLIVVRLKGFHPDRGKFHTRNQHGEVVMHHEEVVKILDRNGNRIDLYMGDLLVYECGTHAVCIYNTFVMGKGSRVRWETVERVGPLILPASIKNGLIEGACVFERIGTIPDEELLVPIWPTRVSSTAHKKRRRKRYAFKSKS